MPTNIEIFHAHDFIKATPHGTFDLEMSKQMLREIASAAKPWLHFEIILDTRVMQSDMSRFDLWHLAEELGKLRAGFFHKMAVLCPIERFDHAGFFALCAENRGFQVRAFTSYEDTMEWLMAKET